MENEEVKPAVEGQDQPQSEPSKETAPEPQQSIDELKAQIESERKLREKAEQERQGYARAVNRLQKEKDQLSNVDQKIERLEKQLELSRRVQSGQIDESQMNQELNRFDQEKQKTEYDNTINQSQRNVIQNIAKAFKRGGIQPNSEQGLQVKALIEEGNFVDALDLANELAFESVKKSVPDETAIRKRIEAELHEAKKKSPALDVEMAKPSSISFSDEEFLTGWGEGSIPATPQNLKRAMELQKRKYGG